MKRNLSSQEIGPKLAPPYLPQIKTSISWPRSPAIWLYPNTEIDVELTLKFHDAGFMTLSSPGYNDKWRIHIDPTVPFNQYSSTYENDEWVPFLDYDGFRDGKFQQEAGWCIVQEDLLEWQRSHLKKIGFTQNEIDDVNYSYGRMLLERQYKEKYFAIYPQDIAIVDSSVSLEIVPKYDTIYRLWLYFVPVVNKISNLKEPTVTRIERKGFTVIELAYLTDREIPSWMPSHSKSSQRQFMLGNRAGLEPMR
jgi:hypothetical protein